MPTNPIGKNTKNVTINLPIDTYKEIAILAKESDKALSTYIRNVLEEAKKDQLIFKTTTVKIKKGETENPGPYNANRPRAEKAVEGEEVPQK